MKETFKKTFGFIMGLYAASFVIGALSQALPKFEKSEEKTSTNSEEEES